MKASHEFTRLKRSTFVFSEGEAKSILAQYAKVDASKVASMELDREDTDNGFTNVILTVTFEEPPESAPAP